MIKQYIRNELSIVIKKYLSKINSLNNDVIYFTVEISPKNTEFDFSTNAAIIISKKLNIKPKEVALDIISIINENNLSFINKAKMDVNGIGFINIKINKEILYKELQNILNQKNKYGSNIIKNHNIENILIEFVSANPTGPLHIGHGRGAALGNALTKILKHLGHKVTKEYYLNDVGNQMTILAKSTELRYRELKGEKIIFPNDYYQGQYIIDIANKLILSGKKIYEIDFKYETIKYILNNIKNDLRKLNIQFDNWFYESSLINKKNEVNKVITFLYNSGFIYIKNKALWLSTKKFGDDKDRVLKKSNKEYTYFATDIAYHKNKFDRGFTKVINIWGADHSGYIARLKSAIQMLGFKKTSLKIILYQLVSLIKNKQQITMSTRSGKFITLNQIINDVGENVTKFFFLLRNPMSQFEFNLELAKKQSKENPVFYIQYVNARCKSIINNSINMHNIIKDINKINFKLLITKEEINLLKQLSLFCDILKICEITMNPNHLSLYLIKLSDKYHKFYETCKVLLNNNVPLTSARLKLVEGVSIIIKIGLDLLGIEIPNKM
ncbi:MAG: arginine--tRNA ligase [Endomicrobium sp.]|jgi:arginyl-tRNA synthetase|nr:arginine--tRNA ligase [Endomicrobium sp.]